MIPEVIVPSYKLDHDIFYVTNWPPAEHDLRFAHPHRRTRTWSVSVEPLLSYIRRGQSFHKLSNITARWHSNHVCFLRSVWVAPSTSFVIHCPFSSLKFFLFFILCRLQSYGGAGGWTKTCHIGLPIICQANVDQANGYLAKLNCSFNDMSIRRTIDHAN